MARKFRVFEVLFFLVDVVCLEVEEYLACCAKIFLRIESTEEGGDVISWKNLETAIPELAVDFYRYALDDDELLWLLRRGLRALKDEEDEVDALSILFGLKPCTSPDEQGFVECAVQLVRG